MEKRAITVVCVFLFALTIYAQKAVYFDYKLPLEKRVDNLVSQMTLEEKAGQLLYNAPAIPRLGIPAYTWWNEALHGVARAGYATVFPQSITIANSWDERLMLDVANAISDEARAKYHEFLRRGDRDIYHGLTFWSPNINIFRDPRWGRGQETYGEDPYLTGRMGLRFVQGMQGPDPKYFKTIATAKHYAIHSGPEPMRHRFNAIISERDLRETYLPAFRTLVKDGGVYSIMGAYNQFRGHPACANDVLYGILRNEWGFKGYVVSDCWAVSDFYTFQGYAKDPVEAAAMALKAGTDLECGVDYKNLSLAVQKGLLNETDIDRAVRRVMTARFKLGMFDPDSIVEYSQIPFTTNCSDYNRSLARRAAQESVVLLKNDKNTLPLSHGIKSLAVIGPNADNWESLTGNYNGIPKDPVTVLKGIISKTEPGTKVIYAEGCDLVKGMQNLVTISSRYYRTPDGRQGVLGEYYTDKEMKGEPLFTRVDDDINFYWENDSPHPLMPVNNFGIHWTADLVPPVTGTYYLASWGSSGYELILNGDTLVSFYHDHHPIMRGVPVEFRAGEKYRLEVNYRNHIGDADMKLMWSMPGGNRLDEAVKAASEADAVVLVLGLSPRLEGEEMPVKLEGFEGGDRTTLSLPETQEELFRKIKETGKPLVVVLMNGGPVSSSLVDEKADAILLAGYPGVEAGDAVADVLFGDYNPAGRLPVTYYRSVDQLPPFDNYDMKGRTYRYFNGEPLYPFGYGLSYTTFSYSDLVFPAKASTGDTITISVRVTNTGSYDGDEVVELYLTDEKASSPRPVRQLEGFTRIHLAKGESRRIELTLLPRQFSIINDKNKRVIEPGWFTLSIGGKQPGFKGKLDPGFTQTITGRIHMTGKEILFSE